MAKNYRVIQIKLNQLVYENVHMIADLGPTSKTYLTLSQYQIFIRVFTYKMAAKINCIDIEQNYVTVTLLQQRDVAHSCTPPPRTVSQLATMNGNRSL